MAQQWNRPFDSGGIRKHFREDPAWLQFQFSFPKTMIILLNFTPSKLHSDLKAPQQSSGSMICISGFMGTCLKIPRSNAILKHWTIPLAPQKGNNYININNPNDILRYDERRKAEWYSFTFGAQSGKQEGQSQLHTCTQRVCQVDLLCQWQL